MRIANCYNNIKTSSPSFGYYHTVGKYSNDNPYFTTTEFFRDDLDWDGVCYYVDNFYKNTPKVNLICYGCSDGEETYSLSLKLKTNLRQNSKKYYPIIAKDIDKDCVNLAKRGRYKISERESEKIDMACGPNVYRYMDIFSDGLEKHARARSILKNDIIFSQADICEDIDNIPAENTVLVCRNFWGYLTRSKQKELAENLGKKLKDNSHVIIGTFDKLYGIDLLLEQNGFEQTEIEGVMKKRDKYI